MPAKGHQVRRKEERARGPPHGGHQCRSVQLQWDRMDGSRLRAQGCRDMGRTHPPLLQRAYCPDGQTGQTPQNLKITTEGSYDYKSKRTLNRAS